MIFKVNQEEEKEKKNLAACKCQVSDLTFPVMCTDKQNHRHKTGKTGRCCEGKSATEAKTKPNCINSSRMEWNQAEIKGRILTENKRAQHLQMKNLYHSECLLSIYLFESNNLKINLILTLSLNYWVGIKWIIISLCMSSRAPNDRNLILTIFCLHSLNNRNIVSAREW